MEPQGAQQVYDEIVAHIQKQAGAYSKWYCGIASNWTDRLFNDHQVPRKGHWHIARQCYNDNDARGVVAMQKFYQLASPPQIRYYDKNHLLSNFFQNRTPPKGFNP